MPTTAERVYSILQDMQRTAGLEPLKRLFWIELNYERANEPFSTRGWAEAAAKALFEPPVLLSTCCGVADWRHVPVRPLTTQERHRGRQLARCLATTACSTAPAAPLRTCDRGIRSQGTCGVC